MHVIVERRFTKGGMEVRQHKKKYEMVVIHTARRTLATLLVNSGLQYHQVMKITGHKKITTLQKYIKSDIDDYPDKVHDRYPFPEPYRGRGEIKAIVLGADPTRILKDKTPQPFEVVFEMDNPKSPYWRGIGKNIRLIDGLDEDNLYVQNLCRNYFTKETSKNKAWVTIARDYWIPFLRKELDELFPQSIPILITTQFILRACLISGQPMKPRTIYEGHNAIAPEDNLLGRKLLALYRHHEYSLDHWKDYPGFLGGEVG